MEYETVCVLRGAVVLDACYSSYDTTVFVVY